MNCPATTVPGPQRLPAECEVVCSVVVAVSTAARQRLRLVRGVCLRVALCTPWR